MHAANPLPRTTSVTSALADVCRKLTMPERTAVIASSTHCPMPATTLSHAQPVAASVMRSSGFGIIAAPTSAAHP